MSDHENDARPGWDWDRLAALMQAWWAGQSAAASGQAHGLSRQRVQQLLARVACTGRRRANRGAPARELGADAAAVADAQWALAHHQAKWLTPRQRGALAWRAQGLGAAAVGRRLGVSAQAAEQLIQRGLARLTRLAATQRPRRAAPAPELPELTWDEVTALATDADEQGATNEGEPRDGAAGPHRADGPRRR